MSILVKNTTVITQNKNRELLKNTDVLVENNTISKIGNVSEKADHTIDGKNRILMPGLINAHTHTAASILRGFGDDMNLEEWLEKSIWPAEAKLTPKYTYWASLLSMAEMIKTGTTCFNDMYFYADSIAKATKEAGMRAILGEVLFDFFKEETKQQELNKAKKAIDSIIAMNDLRTRAAISPHAIYSCAPELLVAGKKIAVKNNTIFHIHVSETKKEVDDCVKKHKLRPIEYLENLGVLGENVVFAHACYLSKNEIDIVKKHEAKIAHCPTSNMKLATGGVIDWP
ncbi:MAG: N-ethylammeline chlorohydrolase, partial [Thermoplasmata archaeon]